MTNNLIQMAMRLKNNPMGMLSQFGVPQNIANNPNEIIQFLMNNGKITQEQYNQAVQMAKKFGYK